MARAILVRVRKMAVNLLTTCCSIIVMLVILEVFLRIFYPQINRLSLHDFDSDLGHRTKSNLNERYVWDGHETVTTVRTNSHGFRNRELAPKRSDEHRMLLLGDSYTFGYAVEDNETFGTILEAGLNQGRRPDEHPYVVVNAGVIGYGTTSEVLQYERIVDDVRADVVVLNITVGNDILDNLCLIYGTSRHATNCPVFDIEDGELKQIGFPVKPEPDSGRTWKEELLNLELSKLGLVRAAGFVGSYPRLLRWADRVGLDLRLNALPGVVQSWYAEPWWPHGWLVMQKLLDRLHDDVSRSHAKLAVVIIPSRLQVLPQLMEVSAVLYRGHPEIELFGRDPQRAQHVLLEYLRVRGIPALDLQPLLATDPDVQNLYYPLTQHWTPAGHRVAAAAIASFLNREGLLENGDGPADTLR